MLDKVVPVRQDNQMEWNGDVLAELFRRIGMRYVALCPGSSFRGLHESMVNYLGNQQPDHLLVLHEEHGVAIAHGYSKVAPEPMGVLVHANVGLMHAIMAVYNAFCDRAPVLVMAGCAGIDASRRVAPAHWQHSVLDQGTLVREFVKWDDQPISLTSAIDSILRAWNIAQTAPRGPVFLTFDQRMQEDRNETVTQLPEPDRYLPGKPAIPRPEIIAEAAQMLLSAKRPVILAGRVSREEGDWKRRIELAEALGATVLTDLKVGAAFPTDHPLHVGPASLVIASTEAVEAVRQADVILSLEWLDMANLFRTAWRDGPPPARIIRGSIDRYIHNGWSREHQGLAPVDLDILAEPDAVVAALLAEIGKVRQGARSPDAEARIERRRAAAAPPAPPRPPGAEENDISLWDIGEALKDLRGDAPTTLIRLPLGWHAGAYPFRHPLDYLGYDGAGGIGSGPGMGVGAALALRYSDRLPIVLVGDGDFLMGSSALWTAAHHRIPLLVLVVNNTSYYVDEVHQRIVSQQRNRTTENAWIGQRISDPEADIVEIARGHGFQSEPSVTDRRALREALQRGVEVVQAGGCYALDIRVMPDYGSTTS